MQNVMKVEHLRKSYNRIPVVDNVSLSVRRGVVFGLIGANGAGKSTTIECILGTKSADSGNISILGSNPLSKRRQLFERIGVQFQETEYQENITVRELCEVTASLYSKPKNPLELLTKFGISHKQKSPVKDLSGGERQRLFIILALIPDPEIVFLDELTTGLDAKARREVWNILSVLKTNGLTIFLTSHFMDEIETLCDCICILKKGRSVFYGTVSEAVRTSPCETFEDAYLWYTEEE
ncbi:ABC transporter ATP-binding protein [Anaerostipes sp.]|uniref:ABC transporter ATP-binding protein n=1 Tax=Anaerostipes sp. TaxID=1872530 RepID=UPI0025BB0EBB|nr:ABC transporter ATP-binding protein [Anaerostipes sp.]MBS7009801.1 ABC transporter ATP-binding protein [Anaerostipes sp.]